MPIDFSQLAIFRAHNWEDAMHKNLKEWDARLTKVEHAVEQMAENQQLMWNEVRQLRHSLNALKPLMSK